MTRKMKLQALSILTAFIRSEIERTRAMFAEAEVEFINLYEDVHAKVEDDTVVLTYDGEGYELFSYYSMGGTLDLATRTRERLSAALLERGYFFEDRNNWSLAVYDGAGRG